MLMIVVVVRAGVQVFIVLILGRGDFNLGPASYDQVIILLFEQLLLELLFEWVEIIYVECV